MIRPKNLTIVNNSRYNLMGKIECLCEGLYLTDIAIIVKEVAVKEEKMCICQETTKPKVFEILVTPDLEPEELNVKMCTEIIHIKQFVDSRLKYLGDNKVIWNGKLFEDVDYRDPKMPWNKERSLPIILKKMLRSINRMKY